MSGECGHTWDGSLHRACPRCCIAAVEAIHKRAYLKLIEAEKIGPSTYASAADAHYYMREAIREAIAILMPSGERPAEKVEHER